MTRIADHPPVADLVSMLAGELAEERLETLIEHIGSCPRCLQRAERIWDQTSPFVGEAPEEMDDALSAEVEERLLGRLYRTELAESLVGLGTNGFLFVVLGLLQPLVHVLVAFTPHPARRR